MSLPGLKKYHKNPYAAISPTRPELSQTGRTVLVSGGTSGIGYAIARAFIKASARNVIITGRRAGLVQSAREKLAEEAKKFGSETVVTGHASDAANPEQVAALWEVFQKGGVFVDVLVLNAATYGQHKTILENGLHNVWSDFETNVRGNLDLTERFYKQAGQGASKRKYLINVSSCAAYMWSTIAPDRPTYGLTKNAGTLLLQQIAKDVASDDMQVVSFHPGGVYTESARREGYEDTGNFDHEDLPGQFAVWAASNAADFLHGRFVWANWDVDELSSDEIGQRIREDEHFLKVGVEGLTEKTGGMIL